MGRDLTSRGRVNFLLDRWQILWDKWHVALSREAHMGLVWVPLVMLFLALVVVLYGSMWVSLIRRSRNHGEKR